jgi:hypothetical protein
MPFDAPFKLGPFMVDSEGRLWPGEPEAAPGFLFRWRDRVVRARLAQADTTHGRIILQAAVARVPSTASTPDDTLRPRIFALLHWLEKSVPADWQVSLLADHRVWLESERRIAMPITAAALITEIACFLLELAPHLDLLDESGLTTLVTGSAEAEAA